MADLGNAIQNIWSSDYVQKNPTKAYKVTYANEYTAVAEYVNGGTRPDPTNFSKLGKGLVESEDVKRGFTPPPPPPPDPPEDGFLWDTPVLSSPVTKTLTKANSGVSGGSGQDLKIVCAEQLNSAIGQIVGYNDVAMENFKLVGGTSGSNGHIIPRENTGIFFMKNGRVQLTVNGDAITVRWRQPKLYHVNMWIEVTKGGTSFHSDGFQLQEAEIDEVGWDRCTFKTDYQGIFLSNEVNSRPGGRSKCTKQIISRTLFLEGAQGLPATFFFKAFPARAGTDPVGITEIYESWVPLKNIKYHVYPNGYNWKAWDGTNNKFGCFLETKRHPVLNRDIPFLRFSTTSDTVPAGMPLAGQTCGDCGVRGNGGFWCYETVTAEILALAGSVGI